MELKPGYKYSDVGVIPNDWSVSTIDELIENKTILSHLDGNHGELYPRSNEFKSFGVPYIAANDFANGTVNFDTCKFLSEERAAKFKKGVAKSGDVLFAHNATVGPVALLETNLPYVILSTTATYFRCEPSLLSNSYLHGALQVPFFVKQYQAVMAQSTRFQVPITAQRKLSLVVPPLPEQKEIAKVLSDVDALIAGLEKLIAKKRDIKQAAMQQLLTGQTRLPGFSGEWAVKTLGDIAHIQKGQLITIETLVPGNVPVIAGGKKPAYFHNKPNRQGKTITVSASGASAGYVAFHSSPIFASDCSTISEAKNYCIEFVYFSLQLNQEVIYSAQTGGAQPHIQPKDISPLVVPLPITLVEQEAIAKVLCDIDDELVALESRLAKTRNIKLGMMQELLTGKTRLI